MEQIIIEKLNTLINEKTRRFNNNVLKRYNIGEKVHSKQLEFHKCFKKNRWVFGGNRTGKTECGAVEAVWLLRGNHPYKLNKKNVQGWSVSLSSQVQRDVAQKKILHYLNPDWIHDIIMSGGKKSDPENGIIDRIIIKNVFGGLSTLGFKSCDQQREKFQGTSLDFVWFDEEPPYDIYLECKMRVLDKSGDIFGTMTPLKGLSWVYSEIFLNQRNDSEVWYEHISWQDNPFLDQDEIKKIKAGFSEDELNSRCDGKFTGFGGMVYSNFDENVNIIDPFTIPLDWQDNISMDVGYKNPLSCHWYATDYDGNIYVVAEHYKAEWDIEQHSKAIYEISNKLNWKRASNGYITCLIDSSALQRTLNSPKSVVDLFYDYKIMANPNVDKDIYAGIQRVKPYFKDANGNSKLFIFKTCVNLIREIKSYFWGETLPIKKDDHALDELRYYIMSKPNFPKQETIMQEHTKYKNKLVAINKRKKLYLSG